MILLVAAGTNYQGFGGRNTVDPMAATKGDIAKARGNVCLDRLQELLTARGARIRRYRKPTFAKPAPVDLKRQIAQECGAFVEALAD